MKIKKILLISFFIFLIFGIFSQKAYADWTSSFSDNFNRADGAIGDGWLGATSTAAISSDTLNVSLATGNPWITGVVLRPVNEVSTVDQRSTATVLAGNSGDLWLTFRTQTPGTEYFIGISHDGHLNLWGSNAGTLLTIKQIAFTYNSSDNYSVDASVIGTNPTTLYATTTDLTTSTVVAVGSTTDSTASLQQAGQVGFFDATAAPLKLDDFVDYSASTSTTSYTLTGPTSGTVNTASTNFTVTPNGIYTGTITPASTGSGTFSPTSLTFASSSAAQTFTYTPTSTAGSPHIISVTSSPGLTNPASINYTVNAAPVSFVSDSFTDTVGTVLESHTGEVGATWTKNPNFSGSVVIDDANRIRVNSGSNSVYYASGVPTNADYDVQGTVTLLSSDADYLGLGGRISTTASTFYFFEYDNATSQWELYKFLNGVPSLLSSLSESFGTIGTSHILKLSMRGTSISGYSDGVLKVSGTDSGITAAGFAGIVTGAGVTNTTGQHLDSFSATNANTTATAYTLTGPTSGSLNTASTNFTITPNGIYTGTITPATTGSGTFSPTSLTFASSSTAQTFTYTPTSTSSSPHTISVTSSPSITDPSSISYSVTAPITTILVNNPNLYWSHDNVYVNGSSYALMLTTESYLKTNFTGTSVAINLDVSALVSASVSAIDYPIIRYQIDGGSWTSVQLASTTTAISITGLTSGTHSLRFEYVSLYTYTDKWNTPVNAIKVTSLSLDNGSTVSTPTILSKTLRVDGDSITEGLRIINSSDTPAGNNASLDYAYLLAQSLGTELTEIGYGAQGWAVSGQGNVPIYPNAVDYYYSGVSRLSAGKLVNPPDYWIVNQGTNDGGDITSAYLTRISQMRTEAGSSTQIFLLVPFNRSHESQITAAYNSYITSNPSDTKVHLLDLGAISYTTTDGLHPDAAGHQTLATALLSAIANTIDIVPPVISSISSGSPTQTGATLTWTTNEPADSQINYGLTSSYTISTTLDSNLVTSHSVNLSNLTAGTTYHYQVVSKDSSGNSATSSDKTFTTASVPATSSGGGGYIAGYGPKGPLTLAPIPCQGDALFNTSTGALCSSSIPQTTTTTPTAWLFTRDLQSGTVNSQVKTLQQYLNAHGYRVSSLGAGSAGNETNYFGMATYKALIKFQKASGIVPASGYFGPITRAYISSHQ